ncbi:murein L,D-transpeptidase [Daejeonella sp.]|jgi:murein L,D-transpeptidase YcbB/YkuD|uniref:L,D-transpeptidase family protein n=1 Tax=Daejeonella sp. TaxID=2805397 RepID=UPI0037848C45
MNFKISRLYFLFVFFFSLSLYGQSQIRSSYVDLRKDSLVFKSKANFSHGFYQIFGSQTKSKFDSLEINRFLIKYPKFLPFEGNIQTFYNQRKMAFTWFDKDGLIEQADNLYNRLSNLQLEDSEEIPYLNLLDSLINAELPSKLTAAQKIEVELFLTAQFSALSEILSTENYPDLLKDINWKPQGQKRSYQEYLDDILKVEIGQIKVGQSLINRQYELLKKHIEKYRELEKEDHYFKIKLEKTSYRLGDSSVIIRKIKLRLNKLGDLQTENTDPIFDLQLENAVKQFQIRHGLLDDGIVGRETVAELNVTYKQRIKQLIVNMERFRWLPENLTTDYIVVNIPEFKLHVFSNNQLQWSCKVVVGKVMNKTVVFNADLKYVVFSPYWNVPQSIVRNEILRNIRKDRNYLQKHQMEITGYRNGLPEIRQKPGTLNALGKVKFIFPNSYNIYLHDTPSKSLFDEPIRAFSHGCIRVSEPFKLAQFLLRNQPDWNDSAIQASMNLGTEKYVSLAEKVSVFIVYFTSFVDPEGRINFRRDIYGRDNRLAELIMDYQD